MSEFFSFWWSLLSEPIDDWLDGLLRILIWIISLGLICLFFFGIFYLFDSSFRGSQEGEGVVICKSFTPAHTTTQIITTGKSTIPIKHFHPDKWEITIELNGDSDKIIVSETYYNASKRGDRVWIRYSTGRISGGLYIKEII